MLTEILKLHLGYALGIGYFFAETMPSVALKKNGKNIFGALMVAWCLVSLNGANFFSLAGPVVFFIVAVIYVGNFNRTISSMVAAREDKIKNLSSAKAELEDALATEISAEAVLKEELDDIINSYMVAKETLTQLNKSDFCLRMVDILMSIEGVRSAAIADERILCSAPQEKKGFHDSVFSDFAASQATFNADYRLPDDVLILSICCGSSAAGYIILEYDAGRRLAVRDKVERVLSIFSLGFNRAVLFEEFEQKSRHDALTGLFNRRYFDNKLMAEVHRATRYKNKFAVLMIDIDHFKKINDTYGHPAGDCVLKIMGEILLSLEYPGSFAGRYGGEEFIVCLPYCDRARALETAERIRAKSFEADFSCGSNNLVKLKITVSIGGAIFPDDGETIPTIISKADDLLYKAKESGRNKVVL